MIPTLMGLALRPWRLSPFSQAFSAVALAFMLTLGAFLLMFEIELRPALRNLAHDQVLTAFIDSTLPAGAEERLADQIRITLGAKDVEVRGVGTTQFLEMLKPAYPGLAQDVESLGAEGKDLVPRHVLIAGVLPPKAEEEVKAAPGVVSVESSRGRYQQAISAYQAVLRIGRWMFMGILLALTCGLFHLGRLNAQMHSESLQLMRLWGAHPALLRVPPALSGLVVGTSGGLLAWMVWRFVFPGLFEQLGRLSIVFQGMGFQNAVSLGPWLALMGIVLGAMTGLAAVLLRSPQT